jgi:hypothetical protein
MNNNEDNPEPYVQPNRPHQFRALNLTMPPFNKGDAEVWFAMLEMEFDDNGILDERTKFRLAYKALDAAAQDATRDLIINVPPENPYATLRQELIRRLARTQDQKTLQLLAHEELGDRKPSEFVRHLKLLDPTASDSIIRNLWLSKLPMYLQQGVAPFKSEIQIAQKRSKNVLKFNLKRF